MVESAVTIPLEQQINGVQGMRYICVDQLERRHQRDYHLPFQTGYDLDIAAVDVQNRVSALLRAVCRQAVTSTGVTITKANSNFVFAAAFYSPDRSLFQFVYQQLSSMSM